MKLDFILEKDFMVEEGLHRSVVVLFYVFFIYCSIELWRLHPNREPWNFYPGFYFYINTFYFIFRVWYRKKEQLADPSVYSIIDYVVETKNSDRKITYIQNRD